MMIDPNEFARIVEAGEAKARELDQYKAYVLKVLNDFMDYEASPHANETLREIKAIILAYNSRPVINPHLEGIIKEREER